MPANFASTEIWTLKPRLDGFDIYLFEKWFLNENFKRNWIAKPDISRRHSILCKFSIRCTHISCPCGKISQSQFHFRLFVRKNNQNQECRNCYRFKVQISVLAKFDGNHEARIKHCALDESVLLSPSQFQLMRQNLL